MSSLLQALADVDLFRIIIILVCQLHVFNTAAFLGIIEVEWRLRLVDLKSMSAAWNYQSNSRHWKKKDEHFWKDKRGGHKRVIHDFKNSGNENWPTWKSSFWEFFLCFQLEYINMIYSFNNLKRKRLPDASEVWIRATMMAKIVSPDICVVISVDVRGKAALG